MRSMQFIPELARYLRQHGCIYTVRAYRYGTSEAYISGVGPCSRELVVQLDESELPLLEDYVTESGFDSLVAWVGKIRYFIPSGIPMYLYRVELVEEP